MNPNSLILSRQISWKVIEDQNLISSSINMICTCVYYGVGGQVATCATRPGYTTTIIFGLNWDSQGSPISCGCLSFATTWLEAPASEIRAAAPGIGAAAAATHASKVHQSWSTWRLARFSLPGRNQTPVTTNTCSITEHLSSDWFLKSWVRPEFQVRQVHREELPVPMQQRHFTFNP